MILEIADIRIQAGKNAAFEQAVTQGIQSVIAKAKGYRSFSLHSGIESPQRYVLQIHWDTLEDHTVGFRGSDLFTQWRAIVGPFFDGPPTVEHFNRAAASA